MPGGTYATHSPSHGSRGGPQRTLAPSAHLASRAVDGSAFFLTPQRRGGGAPERSWAAKKQKLGLIQCRNTNWRGLGANLPTGMYWSFSKYSKRMRASHFFPKGRKTEAPRLGFPNPRKRSTRPRVGLDSLILFGGYRLK